MPIAEDRARPLKTSERRSGRAREWVDRSDRAQPSPSPRKVPGIHAPPARFASEASAGTARPIRVRTGAVREAMPVAHPKESMAGRGVRSEESWFPSQAPVRLGARCSQNSGGSSKRKVCRSRESASRSNDAGRSTPPLPSKRRNDGPFGYSFRRKGEPYASVSRQGALYAARPSLHAGMRKLDASRQFNGSFGTVPRTSA